MIKCVVGVDLGGTKIYTALAGLNGTLLAEEKIPTVAWNGPQETIRRITASIRRVMSTSGRIVPVALGIGVPGIIEQETGIVYSSPNLGWEGVPLKEKLQELLGIEVFIDNDANLAALGEYYYGAGRGASDIIYVTASTGIGCGIILGGKIYRGSGGSGSGEIGHMVLEPEGPLCNCGRKGCLEALASGTAIAAKAKELAAAGLGVNILSQAGGKIEQITALTVARAAKTGDREATGIISTAGAYLGMGLANIINFMNPEKLILGGGVLEAGAWLWTSMEKELKQRVLKRFLNKGVILKAGLGIRSGLLGAAVMAIEAAGNPPPVGFKVN